MPLHKASALTLLYSCNTFKRFPVIYLQWIKLGANLSNFQFSLGSIVFHLGLGGKFKLCSWQDE